MENLGTSLLPTSYAQLKAAGVVLYNFKELKDCSEGGMPHYQCHTGSYIITPPTFSFTVDFLPQNQNVSWMSLHDDVTSCVTPEIKP